MDQPSKLDHSFFLLLGGDGLGHKPDLVLGPVLAEIPEQSECTRLHQQPLCRAVVAPQKSFVLLLHNSVQPDRLGLRLPRNSELHPRITHSRGRDARLTKKLIRQGLPHQRRVGDVVVQIDFGHPAKLLPLDVLVEIDFERVPPAHVPLDERAVALVAHADVFHRLAVNLDIAPAVLVIDTEIASQAGPR